MTRNLKLALVALAAGASFALAQETPTTTSTTTTQATSTQHPDGSTTTQTTITGEVVQYQPGQTIVVRDANGKTQTYTLDSAVTVPSEVQVGRRITVYSSPVDGSLRVQRISLVESTAPDGSKQTRTEVKDEPGVPASSSSATSGSSTSSRQTTTTRQMSSSSSATAPQEAPAVATQETTRTTKTTTVSGTVKAYEPGQSITVVGPGNKVTTYTITTDSQLPQDIAVGKTVTVQTTMVSGKPVVRSVTSKTTTTTKTTKSKTLSPQ
ncbi:MAG TPA: hypothetical protein VE007_02735 [Thermoanaerobaculia bacterium]|nr:hypothetical protein [Thermoanaerobaculia bacterium]